MCFFSRLALPLLLVSLAPLTANAVLAPLMASPISTQNTDTAKTIERGGTVDLFDPVRKILIVDNVKFSLPYYPVKINAPLNLQTGDGSFKLKPKMQIKFTTSRDNAMVQHQVTEIWVTTLSSPVFKK